MYFDGGEDMLMWRGATTTLCRSWREGVLRWDAWCVRCLRAVLRCAVPVAARFALVFSGGKLSISGRTGLDLGRVCGVRRGLQPEVCCVVLCNSLLVLFRRSC